MTGRSAILGLCMLCALFVSAFAAESAGAETKGTTAFTCADLGSLHHFEKEHCAPADLSIGNFDHVAIAENVVTEAKFSNEKTNAATNASTLWVTKSSFGGTAVTLTATGVEGTGTLTNKKAASGEHYTEFEGSLTFIGVAANHNCTVWTDIPGTPPTMGQQGVIHTEPLVATTQGQGHALKFQPKNTSVVKRFWLTDCIPVSANGTYTIAGTFKGTAQGATISFTHPAITSEETLLTNGTNPAGVEGKLTLSARANNTEAYKPISPTTSETL